MSKWLGIVFLVDELQTEAHASTCTNGSQRPTAGATVQNSQLVSSKEKEKKKRINKQYPTL